MNTCWLCFFRTVKRRPPEDAADPVFFNSIRGTPRRLLPDDEPREPREPREQPLRIDVRYSSCRGNSRAGFNGWSDCSRSRALATFRSKTCVQMEMGAELSAVGFFILSSSSSQSSSTRCFFADEFRVFQAHTFG